MNDSLLEHNMKVEVGFFNALEDLATKALPVIAKTVLPALDFGALSGLASTGVQKTMEYGLYWKRGGGVCQLNTDGKG